jgi:carboxypeptidase C (cathepsin A)
MISVRSLWAGAALSAALLASSALSPRALGGAGPAYAADDATAPKDKPAGADKSDKPVNDKAGADKDTGDKAGQDQGGYFKPEAVGSDGSVTVRGQAIDYHAVVGTMVVHPKDWDDAPQKPLGDKDGDKDGDKTGTDDHNPTAEAAMSYVAYFKKGAAPAARPIMFLYNGGPGSSTVWLHMGAFGPRRVVTLDDQHSPAAPYQLVNNDSSLLDAADLVFVDAPGTGFGRIAGPNKEKAFWGVDPDAHAFASFITGFLSKYGRWNSPKYLFGESYGTTRNAAVINLLETEDNVDFNGVIMLSQILNFGLSDDDPDVDPGNDLPYVLALPTYAATAYYHHKLSPMPDDLKAFLTEVESFTTYEYTLALGWGNLLPGDDRKHIAEKLHDYTGLPIDYINKANLRINGGEFEKTLQDSSDTTTGRLDTRFSGPTMDPLSKEADYDPQSAAISSAYVSAFNDYVRRDLHFGEGRIFKPEAEIHHWDFTHTPPGSSDTSTRGVNVMPDLATALKYNPNLKVLVNGGYYDLATPYFSAVYELRHLQIPQRLMPNITFKTYESGHMVYANPQALTQLHDNVAAFVAQTDNVKAAAAK